MVRKRGKFYYTDFTFDGDQVRKTTRTANRKDAEEFEQRERERHWRLKKLGDSGTELWEVVTKKYLEETGAKREEQILKWFAPKLNGTPLRAITAKVIDQLRQLRLTDTEYRNRPVVAALPRDSRVLMMPAS